MSLAKRLKRLWKNIKRWYYKQPPNRYFVVPVNKWRSKKDLKPLAVLWAFAHWKWDVAANYLPGYRLMFGVNPINSDFWLEQKKILDKYNPAVFICWGFQAYPEAEEYAHQRGIPIYRMEDGFIRSADLGCKHTLPLSLVLDKMGIYFDATRPSDLENILATYDFAKNSQLIEAAERLMEIMKALKVTKYNIGRLGKIKAGLGPKQKYRILVVGQVEDDASLEYGLASGWTNIDLLKKAHDDHPEAEIIYRPHPDTLHHRINANSSVLEDMSFCTIYSDNIILADLFSEVDHVYTMTSLSGFEALLHGLKVTVVGMPFYAGWGLTDDVQTCPRRTRKLTLVELFCGSYLLYPRYLLNMENAVEGCLETMVQVIKPQFSVIGS